MKNQKIKFCVVCRQRARFNKGTSDIVRQKDGTPYLRVHNKCLEAIK